MNKLVKLILKYALILALFCGTAGLLLSTVYNLTEPLKAANQASQKTAGEKQFFPEMDKIADGAVYDARGNLLGYLLTVTARGYSSDIELLAALDSDLHLLGIRVLSQAETPGLGAKITGTIFIDSLQGLEISGLKLKKDGGTLDGITGATITSRAVIDGIRREAENLRK